MPKIYSLFIGIVFLAACSSKQKGTLNPIPHIDGKWILLTDWENDLVQVQPCDANNPSIEIRKNKLTIDWGQSQDEFTIETIAPTNNGRYAITTRVDSVFSEQSIYTFSLLDSGKAKWWLLNDTIADLYVDETHASRFKILKQPCIECWSSEECARLEMIGNYKLRKSDGDQTLIIESIERGTLAFSIQNNGESDCKGKLVGNAIIDGDRIIYQTDGCGFEFKVAANKIEIINERCEAQNPLCRFSGVYLKSLMNTTINP